MAFAGRTNVIIELADGGWALLSVEMIEHDGGYWLVPRWTVSEDGRSRQPVRIVTLAAAESGAPAADPEAFAGRPIPEAVFSDGHVPLSLANRILVRERPDLWFPLDSDPK